MDKLNTLNEYIVGDNLEILKNIDTYYDFCYIDPPYNTGRDFGNFMDKFDDMKSFIDFLKPRIELIHSKLKDNGTFVLHVDSIASHYCKVMLDDIFGIKNFNNEIVLCTSGMKKVKTKLMRSHDILLVYSKNKKKSTFNVIYLPYPDTQKKFKKDNRGEYVTSAAKNSQPDVIYRPNLRYEWNGHHQQWWVSKEKMQSLHDDNRLEYNAAGIPRIKRYLSELDGIPLKDVWDDISSIQGNEKLDYATQKPIKLLERLLELYTNESDNCIDFFAGSGTLGRACIKMKRNYTLIDLNKDGKDLFENTKPTIHTGELTINKFFE
jgi:DNA modification methylase